MIVQQLIDLLKQYDPGDDVFLVVNESWTTQDVDVLPIEPYPFECSASDDGVLLRVDPIVYADEKGE